MSSHDTDPDQLVARTLQLLSKAATVGVCRGRMKALVNALGAAADHPQVDPAVRKACASLASEWRAAQAEHFPGAEPLPAVLH